LEVIVAGWGELEAMLRSGQADAALLHSPFDRRGIDLEPVRTEPRVAVLPEAHRLAGRRRLRRVDLTAEVFPRWVDATPDTASYWQGRDLDSLRKAWPARPATDDQPLGPVVADLAQLLATVALGQAVALLPASVAERNPRAGVIYRPVTDISPSVTAIAWPETSHSLAVATLVRAATELTAGQQQPPAILA
jgi:DNA-binding transcriptional LysR family regulator